MKEVGRIITDGKGTEKIIYPKFSTPETPPKNIIVYPDKKEVNIDWRKNFNRVIETQKMLEEANIGQEEAIVHPDLEYPDLPMLLAIITDAHIFGVGTDHELLQKHLDLVINQPNVRMLDCGDAVDMGIWGDLVFEQVLPPYMQGFTMRDLVRELGDKMIAVLGGNHDNWMKACGTEFYDAFLRDIECPIMPAGGMIHLEVGKQTYDIAAKHTHWGRSKLNATNAPKRLIQWGYPEADCAILGHSHQASMEQFYMGGKNRLAVVGGNYKLNDQWSKRRGINDNPERGGLGILFYPNERKMIPFLQMEDGVEYLNTLIELKKYT